MHMSHIYSNITLTFKHLTNQFGKVIDCWLASETQSDRSTTAAAAIHQSPINRFAKPFYTLFVMLHVQIDRYFNRIKNRNIHNNNDSVAIGIIFFFVVVLFRLCMCFVFFVVVFYSFFSLCHIETICYW